MYFLLPLFALYSCFRYALPNQLSLSFFARIKIIIDITVINPNDPIQFGEMYFTKSSLIGKKTNSIIIKTDADSNDGLILFLRLNISTVGIL